MKKMYFVLIFAFVCVFMFVSCGQELGLENSESRYLLSRGICGNTGTFWRASWGGALQGLPSNPCKIVITDTKTLQELFSDTYSLSLNEAGDDWFRDERFSNFIARYDDTFFESKQLVAFFLSAPGGGYEFRLDGTAYIDGILNINIYDKEGAGIAAMVEWFAIVETDKVPADTVVYVNIKDRLGRIFTF